MKSLTLILIIFLNSFLSAGELPWIGVSLNPPTVEERAKTPLNQGVGFLVGEVVAGGPLAKAGGKERDLWWKFDGQILVNKSQMVVLLQDKAPGEVVEIDFYRDGELLQIKLTLEARQRPNVIPVGMVPERASTSRVLAKREQVARVTVEGKELSLETEGDHWRFRIKEEGTTVLSALTGDLDFGEKIPSRWHGAYLILRQTLESSAAPSGPTPSRRVRYIRPSKSSME